ncbi:hypothetical protein CANINC_002632 [Pichia inconspicua]|uniref:Uncharacterized protein n=1 Tax=Pichia inconspicua TaxID=52247 RepID=A0A4T0X135_9ASCO|nr:hypothetical protein CANINC_002632 [[Candida] inconspicua]
MTTRVIFTRRRKDDETSRLYTRVTTRFEHQGKLIECVGKNSDPMMTKINTVVGMDNTEIYLLENMVFEVNILLLNNGNFEQYRGKIDNTAVENMLQSNLVSGTEPVTLYVWIYGLIISGDYDDGESYRFEFVSTGTELYWSIKMIDNGIYKTVLSIKMENVEEIDIDEYFLEDLEQLWNISVEHKKKEKEWQLEKVKMVQEMEVLRKRTGIEHLQNSLRTMKAKIIDYFLPLVNNLLLEKKKLLAQSADEGDTIFLRALKRKRGDGLKEEENDDVERDVLDIDEFMEAERHKRMKGIENAKVDSENDVHEKENRALSFDVETDEDSIKFNGKKRTADVETAVEEMEIALNVVIEADDLELNKAKNSELVVLDEDTDADGGNTDPEITEISTEVESAIEHYDTDIDEDTQL